MNAITNVGQRGPQRKRYHHQCKSCRRRFMSSRTDALYCSDACSQHMKRKRRKDRQRQVAEQARRHQAEMDRRIEEHRQAQADEDRRLEREQAQADADQGRQRQQADRQRDLARRAAEVQRLYSPCKRCGSSHFNVQALEVPVHFLTTKLKLDLKVKCAHCGERSSYVIQPGPCPVCKHYVYIWDVQSGGLQCRKCKSTRQWRDYRIDVPLPEPYDPPINLR